MLADINQYFYEKILLSNVTIEVDCAYQEGDVFEKLEIDGRIVNGKLVHETEIV